MRKKFLAIALLVIGTVMIFGVAMADEATPQDNTTVAQPPEGAEYVGSTTCFQCHSGNYRAWQQTKHAQREAGDDPARWPYFTTGFDGESFVEEGIACEACHGPGSAHVEAAMALETDDPNSQEVYDLRQLNVATVDAAVCGQCHSAGTDPSGNSYPADYVLGGPFDESVFTLADPSNTDLFWATGHEKNPGMQYNVWVNSAHGNALATIQENDHGSESCLNCHSTDYVMQDTTFEQDVVTLENAQFSITCVQCHAPHGEAAQVSQLRDEAYSLCVSCHTGTDNGNNVIRVGDSVHHPMREMFEGISFLGLDPNPSPHFANEAFGPICSSCHMPQTVTAGEETQPSHTWNVVLPTDAEEGQVDSCTSCHSLERNPDNTPENLTFIIESVQEDTMERVEDIRADLDDIIAEHPEWADTAEEDMTEGQMLADEIGTLVSFVEADGSWGFHNPGYTDDILAEAEDLLDELFDVLDE